MRILGVDIGGTKTLFAFYSIKDNNLILEREEKHITRGFTTQELFDLISERSLSVDALAFSTPGFVKQESIVNTPNNRAIEGKDFLELIKSLNKPFIVENDANCFTYAESVKGAGKSFKNGIIVGWIFGTGIGGGIVLKDKGVPHLLIGESGEFGHQLVPFEKIKDIINYSTKAKSSLLSIGALDLESIASGKTREELSFHYQEFEKEIKKAVAYGFYNVQRIINPTLHVVGGGYGLFLGKEYFAFIEKEVKEMYIKEFNYYPDISIKISSFGEISGAYGAALMLKEKLKKF